MESYLDRSLSVIQWKTLSKESLERWMKPSVIGKKPKRRKRSAMRKTDQETLVLTLPLIPGVPPLPSNYTPVPDGVEANSSDEKEAFQDLSEAAEASSLIEQFESENSSEDKEALRPTCHQTRHSEVETMGSANKETLLERQPAFQSTGQSEARTTGSMNQIERRGGKGSNSCRDCPRQDGRQDGSMLQQPLNISHHRDLEAATSSGQPHNDSDTQVAVLQRGYSVSSWVTGISATGIIGFVAAFFGNYKAILAHKLLIKACTVSLLGSFVSGALGLLLQSIIRPDIQRNIPGLILPVKVNTWISIGLMTVTVIFFACIVLQAS